MNQARRKFDDNFKREAVNHWLSSGKPASQVSKELGISNANLLYNWKQRFAPDDAGRGHRAPGGCRTGDRPFARATRHSKKTLDIISEPPRNASSGSTR